MIVSRRQCLHGFIAAAGAFALTGCATVYPAAQPLDGLGKSYAGRLSLAIFNPSKPQNFTAGFQLQGHARRGTLDIEGPLGITMAQVRWTPTEAIAQQGKMAREYPDMESLMRDITGANVPVAALFDWLEGKPTPVPGWQPDLSQLPQGRLSARRTQPHPEAELVLLLEQD